MCLYKGIVWHITSVPLNKGVLAVSQLAKNCSAFCRERRLIVAFAVADRLSPNPIQSNPVCNIPPHIFTIHFSIVVPLTHAVFQIFLQLCMYFAWVWCLLHIPPVSPIWPSEFTGNTNYEILQSVTSLILSFIGPVAWYWLNGYKIRETLREDLQELWLHLEHISLSTYSVT
jgi:hypothetical protein